jgi:tRNA(Ile)-lysidine synthase
MIVDRVRQFVRQHDLMRVGKRVVAAVSGGSDSVALALVLQELAAAGEVHLAGIAHFNHQLRPTADAEEQFAQQLAAGWRLPFLSARGDVAERARREGRSIEDAARSARHEFFEVARRHFDADHIALGHTRDDQAETVLLRLSRGAGPRGLAGMHPRNGFIIRPLLTCRREELRAWIAERSQTFIDDESNQDVSIPRNRVRAELLPLLATRFNPAIVDVLADEAEIAQETWRWMESLTSALDTRLVRRSSTPDGVALCEIDVVGLQEAPLALRRALLWRLMSEVAQRRPIAFGHVSAVLRLMDEGSEAAIDIPGQRVQRIGPSLVLTGRAAGEVGRRPPDPGATVFHFPLSIPGEVSFPAAGWVVSATSQESAAAGNVASSHVARVRFDLCRGSLAVRNRRSGDRFRPVGMDGQKKLQDYFVDRKVARADRDRVPLVVDQTDRIVWVAGYGIDEAFRVTDDAEEVIILTLKALGGSA